MKVLIIGSSKLPIPAVKGGAVPTLIEEIIAGNEKNNAVSLTCCSLYDRQAVIESEKYHRTNFIWAKCPNMIKKIDRFNSIIFKNLFRIEHVQGLGFFYRIWWFAIFVAKQLKKDEYDQVVFENSIPLLTSLKLFGNMQKYKGKICIHLHAVPHYYFGNQKILENCRKIIVVSDYVKNAILRDTRLKIEDSQFFVMRNCLDTSLFKPMAASDELRRRFEIKDGEKLIVFVGRLCAEKGIIELIEAIKLMKRHCKLLIAGSNFYKTNIQSPFEKYLVSCSESIKDKVIFTGFVDYKNMPEIYNLADIVVLPSMWEEPAGMTMLEAMACGKPLITTRSGGIPEYVGEGNCILLNRDQKIISEIADNIEKILEDQAYVKQLAEKGCSYVKQYNVSYYYRQFLNILQPFSTY